MTDKTSALLRLALSALNTAPRFRVGETEVATLIDAALAEKPSADPADTIEVGRHIEDARSVRDDLNDAANSDQAALTAGEKAFSFQVCLTEQTTWYITLPAPDAMTACELAEVIWCDDHERFALGDSELLGSHAVFA